MRSRLNRQYLPTRKAGSSPEPASICTMRCDIRSSSATSRAVSTSSRCRRASRSRWSRSSLSGRCPFPFLSFIELHPRHGESLPADVRPWPTGSFSPGAVSAWWEACTNRRATQPPIIPQGEKLASQTILRSPLVIRSSSASSLSCRYSFSSCQKLSPGWPSWYCRTTSLSSGAWAKQSQTPLAVKWPRSCRWMAQPQAAHWPITDGWPSGGMRSAVTVQSIAGAAAVDRDRVWSDRDGGAHGHGACLIAIPRLGELFRQWPLCTGAGKAVGRLLA